MHMVASVCVRYAYGGGGERSARAQAGLVCRRGACARDAQDHDIDFGSVAGLLDSLRACLCSPSLVGRRVHVWEWRVMSM